MRPESFVALSSVTVPRMETPGKIPHHDGDRRRRITRTTSPAAAARAPEVAMTPRAQHPDDCRDKRSAHGGGQVVEARTHSEDTAAQVIRHQTLDEALPPPRR